VCRISQPFVTYLIYTSQHSDVTRMQTSTDLINCNKAVSCNREGMFQQDGAHAHTSKATITWLDANINTTFRFRTGRLIHRICLLLRTFGALWQQPFIPTPILSHCNIEALSPKSMEINFSVNTSKSCRFDA